MREWQKRELIDCIKSLEQAHKEIKETLSSHNYNLAQNMISECQEFAITLGNTIENLNGKDHITVSYVEEYCEVAYEIFQILGNTQVNENKIYKILRKQLLKIENSINNDINIKREVVFLPYKASMWDSLESVWMAAEADKNCDAYVIPVPYYNKNPDGSFREMHYEGGQYPDYVPIVKYDNYDFALHKPDAIYIHNPYDQYNYVTSIHPFFFSENLKKFTQNLIYIPYFILDENISGEERKHFCTVPGVLNADKVIVQSDRIKQMYIKALIDIANTHDKTTEKYLNDKILGLGSPKIDKVLNTKKEDLIIPKKWREIIEKPDGGSKKIIFYNTGIAALLQHNEKMLYKIKCVFNIFREKKDEIVLLWRPHPLIKATVESMRPQLWQEYTQIVNQYKEEGWGIYDDSADLDRAIILSDAYYGDESSVIQLYEQIGKMVMIQNVNIIV